jgi:hypothetical protein
MLGGQVKYLKTFCLVAYNSNKEVPISELAQLAP